MKRPHDRPPSWVRPRPNPVRRRRVLAVAAGLTMFLLVHAYDQAHHVEPQLLAYGSALLSLLSTLVAWELSGA